MHIVLTVNQAWNIWNFRQPLVEGLLADGHEVTVLAPPDDTVAKLEAIGARFEPLRMDAGSFGAAENLALVSRFSRAFGALRPDIVCGFTIKNNLFGAMAARRHGIPFLPNVTGLGTVFLGSRALFQLGRTLYRIALAKSRIVFVQNADDRDFLVANAILRADQLRLLPGSGIDTQRFAQVPLPGDPEGPSFLMISRLLRDKGIVEYLEAARWLKAERPGVQVRLLGPLGSNNRTAIGAYDLQPFIDDGSVAYLGETDDVRPFIAAADCVVLPSYREGAPRSLIEAASMGRPLVATDVPGCRAVVDDALTGFLCPAKDSAGLGEAMRRIADLTPAERQAMGDAGRAKMVREYSVSHVVDAYRNAIAELTSQARNDLASAGARERK